MPNTINSQYMGMPVPVPTVDPGPQWATDVNTCLTTIDQHDHSSGKGTPVTPNGININSDLSFVGNNAIALRSSRYNVQASPLSGISDLGCLYVSGVDLYFNDENGNQIRMTASGSVSGTAGSITGLVPPANVTYTGFNQTFTFQSSTATAASLDGGSVTIRNLTANSPGITLSPPAGLASNYTVTFPQVLPSTGKIVRFDSSGNLSATLGVDNSTLIIASSSIQVKNFSIGPTQQQALNFAASSTCDVFITSSGDFVRPTNLFATITVSGLRPVRCELIPEPYFAASSGHIAWFNPNGGNPMEINCIFTRNGTPVMNQTALGGNISSVVFPNSIFAYDFSPPASSSYTYEFKINGSGSAGGQSTMQYCRLLVYEI